MAGKKAEPGILGGGFLSIFFGVTVSAFAPHLTFLSWGSYALGGLSILMHFTKDKADQWEQFFKNTKLYVNDGDNLALPKVVSVEEKETEVLYTIKMPVGLSSEDLYKRKKALEELLNSKVDITYNNGFVYVKAIKTTLGSFYKFEKVETENPVTLLLGRTLKGILTLNLLDGEPHLLISGGTKSGKSSLIRNLLLNSIMVKLPTELELLLIDLKGGAELRLFENSRLTKDFAKDIKNCERILKNAIAEVERRLDLFYKVKVQNLEEYNKKVKKDKLPFQLLVIDEFSVLNGNKVCMRALQDLAARSRAVGVHLILSTQYPTRKLIDGLIRANVCNVIGLRCGSAIDSEVIFGKGETELADITVRGRGILKVDYKTEFQSMYVAGKEAEKLIKPFEKSTTQKPNNKVISINKKQEEKENGEVKEFNFF